MSNVSPSGPKCEAKKVSSSEASRRKDAVMGTNNSSIVSKRSVERIYMDQPHFFRYFVNKPQRRSPLINRGYWLRMRAIEVVIDRFLNQITTKKKAIVNLGCGYDPLAFQWLSKSQSQCVDCLFIDVDFPALVERKCQVIYSTPQLSGILGETQRPVPVRGIHLLSGRYCAIGCDLSDIRELEKLLGEVINLSKCLVLCTAEVSMTYMPKEAADNLIAWAARLEDAQFCLMEQFLPDGPEHPFARKMLHHFENLRTPLRNIMHYASLQDIIDRFRRAGWSSVAARSLWDVYCDTGFVSVKTRLRLNEIEPFDEWEEFILFASHYFLLTTGNVNERKMQAEQNELSSLDSKLPPLSICLSVAAESKAVHFAVKRFGQTIALSDRIGHHGGLEPTTRTATTDMYVLDGSPEHRLDQQEMTPSEPNLDASTVIAPAARMCHTITPLSESCMLVGGRKSPNEALKDCWKLSHSQWQRLKDLPLPLFRHCAAPITLREHDRVEEAVLIYGGKHSASNISDKWLLWRCHIGWRELSSTGDTPVAGFGCALAATDDNSGILTGGMALDGMILQDHVGWRLVNHESDFQVDCRRVTLSSGSGLFKQAGRFGAVLQTSRVSTFLIGGVSNGIIPESSQVIQIVDQASQNEFANYEIRPVMIESSLERTLLVGHCACKVDEDIYIMGGGALCFSFGTHWNATPLVLSEATKKPKRLRTGDKAHIPYNKDLAPCTTREHPKMFVSIKRSSITSSEEFASIIQARQPAILEGLDLGHCVDEWGSLSTLKEKVGADREVVVHECAHTSMDFQSKNFSYVKKPFGQFVDDVDCGSKQYLRSLASHDSMKQPANLMIDFPRLASSFQVPRELQVVNQSMHSSVLRVSGPVNMWLHYDVMANVLCQIRASKELLLFPPSDVSYLSLPAGSSSSAIDCFKTNFNEDPQLVKTNPHHALLQPGDILYIPPLWLHTASPTDGVSVAVNVFFRDLDSGYAPGRDVYGNRDVQAYETGRRDIERICRSFDHLPVDMRGFYLDRLSAELKDRAWNVR